LPWFSSNMFDRYIAQVQDEPGFDVDVTGEGAGMLLEMIKT